jgi:hypothetical protein
MKLATVPAICCFALTAMTTAGLSHWWSVRQFIASIHAGSLVAATPPHIPQPAPVLPATTPAKSPAPVAASPVAAKPVAANPASQSAAPNIEQKKFYEALISKMESLQTQNRDLLDQLAETNRDLMKLEFRVDTHSESFRPMPVSEDRPFTSLDDTSGVLPPRAEPVVLPLHE